MFELIQFLLINLYSFIVLLTLCLCTLSQVEKMSNMSRTMTIQEALEHILDQDSEVEEEESESKEDLEIKSDHDDKLSDDEG